VPPVVDVPPVVEVPPVAAAPLLPPCVIVPPEPIWVFPPLDGAGVLTSLEHPETAIAKQESKRGERRIRMRDL